MLDRRRGLCAAARHGRRCRWRALAPGAVCYVTSFSKAVLPGLRIGYISALPP